MLNYKYSMMFVDFHIHKNNIDTEIALSNRLIEFNTSINHDSGSVMSFY